MFSNLGSGIWGYSVLVNANHANTKLFKGRILKSNNVRHNTFLVK